LVLRATRSVYPCCKAGTTASRCRRLTATRQHPRCYHARPDPLSRPRGHPTGASHTRVARSQQSAHDVQDGIRIMRSLLQRLDGLRGREDHELELAPSRLVPDLIHDRQVAIGPGADDQVTAFPWNLFCRGYRCVSESVSKLLRGLLLAFADLAVVDDHIV